VWASYHGRSLEDEVWTAGHCVANTESDSPGVYATNVEFVPAYNGTASTVTGRYPFGVFTATRTEVPTAWLDDADRSVNEATMEVGTNSRGQTLGQAVGYEGSVYNEPVSENFTAVGYPAASPYTGNLITRINS